MIRATSSAAIRPLATAHVSVTGPDGEELAYYAKNVDCVGGTYEGSWGLALNEKPGTYVLTVRDVATGMMGEAEIEVGM